MQYVSQHPHPNACQQACYAMLAGRTLDDVIRDVGHAKRMAVEERAKIVALYGIQMNVWEALPVGPHGIGDGIPLGPLMEKHGTLLCSVNDYLNANFGHCIVIHAGQLYDPWDGMNPNWPWSRFITRAHPVDLRVIDSGKTATPTMK